MLRSQPPSVPVHLQRTETLVAQLKPITLPENSRRGRFSNWGGTFTAQPSRVFQPTTVGECCAILELARRSHAKVRAVGKAHSPSDLMMSEDWCVMMEGVSGILSIDADDMKATFLSGTIISDINEALAANSPPLAMRSLGSISEQTIGGLISTATHGSGIDLPCVSAFVQELEIILPLPPAQGGVQIVRCSRCERSDLFNASLCGLGATGLIVTVKMDIDPAFRLRHLVEEVEFEYLIGPKTGFPRIAEPTRGGGGGSSRASSPPSPTAVFQSNPSAEQAGSETLTDAISQAGTSLGVLLARGQPLPTPPGQYLPHVSQSSPANIWPKRATEDEDISRNHTGWSDPADDDETRDAQRRIESVVRSAQHTRLWYFPHVNMATLSRANRTLDPPVAPTWSERAYASVVGYHFTQFLLYVSRYHHSLPPRIGRVIHWLTHPAFPSKGKTVAASCTQQASSASITTPQQTDVSSDYASFVSGATSSRQIVTGTAANASLTPLEPHHPHSISTDHSWKVFNMDCLFPQYTTEWCIPFEHTGACLRALRDWLDEERALLSRSHRREVLRNDNDGGDNDFSSSHLHPTQLHMPLEIRFTSADGIWLSHGYGRLNTYIGLITYRPYNTSPPYRRLFRKFEHLMRYFAGRPHWAKEHTCGVEELKSLYPHWEDWKRVRAEADPEEVLVNAYVGRHVMGYVGEEYGSRVFKRRESGRVGKL